MKLRITTVGKRLENHRRTGVPPNSTLDDLRRNASAKMDTYLEDLLLPQNHQICDSVVRRYSIHSEKLFSIEQEISISVMSLGEQWVGMFEAFPN